MNELTNATKLQRASLPGSKINDEMVFFNSENGKYYGTGAVGTEIWDCLEQPKSIHEICDHLLSKFDVDRETCEAQVREFVGELLQGGIVSKA